MTIVASRTALLSHAHAILPCKICGMEAAAFDVVDFNKCCSHEDFYQFGFSGVIVPYFRCRTCGCIFTNFFDDWTAEQFSRDVYNEDYHKVDSEYASLRPIQVARLLAERWRDCRAARVLDYGSGAGVFAAELRRLGFADVQGYDPFSSPARPQGRFDIITCLEVIEHSPTPRQTMRDMCGYLKDDGCIIVSQTLQPPQIAQLRGNWWYIAPRNGHICTFTPEAMALLAQSAGLTFTFGEGPYGFARPRRSAFARRALATMGRPYYAAVLAAPAASLRRRFWRTRQWHDLELGPRGPFRWSAAGTLSFPAPVTHAPATLRAILPLLDQITPELLCGVAGQCGGPKSIFHREGDSLVADLQVTRPAAFITVRTVPPIRPSALRPDHDHRKLGLAVRASAA